MRRRLRTAEAAARGRGPVLLCGEAGTGRRLIARAIAAAGSAEPAVLVSCHAIAGGRGLFGTPARPGLVEQEPPMPLVLVGIDELQPDICARLLDALARPGAPRLFAVSQRPIADLARPLARDARERLAAMTIDVPPLRERPEELPLLIERLLDRIAARLGRIAPTASTELVEALRAHPWPGNVAELEAVLAAEVARAPADADLLFEVPATVAGRSQSHDSASAHSIAEAERQLLIQALRQHRGNVPRVARTLGVSKGTVYNKMRKYRVDPTTYRVSS